MPEKLTPHAAEPSLRPSISRRRRTLTFHTISSRRTILIYQISTRKAQPLQEMDRATTSSRGDFSTPDPQSIASPDPEARGRKRRRDPLNLFPLSRHKPSGESSTLRGRCRHRSTSHHTDRDSRALSPAPERRRLLVGAAVPRPENHRRSQSPSRSRSLGENQVEVVAQSGRPTLGLEGWAAKDGAMAKD